MDVGPARQIVLRMAAAAALVASTAGCERGTTSGSPGSEPTTAATGTAAAPTLVPPDPTPAGSCSASSAPEIDEASEQQALPEPVARTRRQVLEAALACDYAALAQLAQAAEEFTYSFGGGADPGGFWQAQEEQGEDPLRHLVGLLRLPHRYVQEHDQYVWPAAFAYESWGDVPEQARQDLTALYTPSELAGFAQFGAYVGYRIGIDSSGRWLFFVAGD